MTMILSAVVILAMCWALVKKYETRLVLIAGGLILACMAGDPLAPLVSFSKSMKQANVFEVIIASMGFAAVVKMTGLHTHLIAVFLKLLKKAGPFVIIGVSLATTIVNSPSRLRLVRPPLWVRSSFRCFFLQVFQRRSRPRL